MCIRVPRVYVCDCTYNARVYVPTRAHHGLTRAVHAGLKGAPPDFSPPLPDSWTWVRQSVGVSICSQRSAATRLGFLVRVVKLRTLRSVLGAAGTVGFRAGLACKHAWETHQPESPTAGSADPKLIYLLLVPLPWVHWPASVLKCSLFSDVR